MWSAVVFDPLCRVAGCPPGPRRWRPKSTATGGTHRSSSTSCRRVACPSGRSRWSRPHPGRHQEWCAHPASRPWPGRSQPPRPRQPRGPSPRRPQLGKRLIVDRVEQSPHRGLRRDRAEQLGLAPQHREVRDRLAPVGERHRHIPRDPTRIVARGALSQPNQRLRQRPCQTGRVGQIRQQPGTRVAHTPRPSAETTILGREEVRFTLRVLLDLDDGTIDKSYRPR
jgi:hypothetical protein